MIQNIFKSLAVIDIGSHSVKMQIGELQGKEKIKTIENLVVPIAIGQDTFNKGIVTNSTIQELINALKKFKEMIEAYKIEHYKAYATSGLREASNSETLLERIYNETGIRIKLIEQIEEIKILYDGLKQEFKNKYGFTKDNILIIAIGAGSTMLVIQSKGKILFTETHNIGTLRLLKKNSEIKKTMALSVKYSVQRFLNILKNFPQIIKIDKIIVLNDDIINILSKKKVNPLKEKIYLFNYSQIKEINNEIIESNKENLKEQYQLTDIIANTTKIAFLMLDTLLNYITPKFILLPEISFSSALLNKLTFIKEITIEEQKELRENIISSAISLGCRYKIDMTHSLHIKNFALKIYNYLKEHYIFQPNAELYLEISALLHDIGYFVNSKNHHKFSEIIICSSEILGLDSEEMKIIALIARYHRKAIPKKSHKQYMSLSTKQRLLVSQLAGILRIADALDRENTQIVEDIFLSLENGVLRIKLKMKNNLIEYLDVLKTNVKSKANLFENFFGLKVKIEAI